MGRAFPNPRERGLPLQPRGVELRDGTTAGVGDLIVTRRNNRALTNRTGTRFVHNGDTWTITHRHRNGDLTARHASTGHDVRLPHQYVTAHVDLGYATTTSQAQGRTVDTTHALIDTTSREHLYVAATRARHHTELYVNSEDCLKLDAERPPAPTGDAVDQLARIITRQAGELTATEVQRGAAAIGTRRENPSTSQSRGQHIPRATV